MKSDQNTPFPEPVEGPLLVGHRQASRKYGPSTGSGKGIFLAALAIILTTPAPALADTVVENVNGITLTAEGKVQRFVGMVIGDDGKVMRLMATKEPPPTPPKCKRGQPCVYPPGPKFRLDGKGRTLLPGLIDAHGHMMGIGWQAVSLDLSSTVSLDDAKAKIKDYADANPSQKWIVGRGWNQEAWKLGRFPTAADLDSVVSDRPVWLERVDGHAGWANSAAMAAAGVTAKSVSPPGGRIEMGAGKPSGVFVDAASELVQKSVPQPLAKERDVAFLKAQDILLGFGITGIADMGTSVDDWLTYRRAGDGGYLRTRIYSYSAGLGPMLQIAGGEPTPWLYDAKLRMGGVKLYSDGALGSRGAYLKAAYADKPGERGLQFLTDSAIRNQMSRAAMDGFQVAVHAIGDGANAQLLDAIDELSLTYSGDRRWRVEHAQIVDPVDIPRFAKNGVIASMQPVHQTSDRTMAEARLGPDRLKGAYAWGSILRVGGKLAFGSDVPVESADPFAGIAAAITREDAKGEPFGGWQPQERVTIEQALAGFTTGAAYAAFAEGKTGRLAPGLYADFILVDRDPLLSTPSEIRAIKVSETWVGGVRMFSRK